MKRSRIIALVLVAVVVVVLAVVLRRDAADERDVPEVRPDTVAQILPADTVAYLTVSDPASLLRTAEEGGLLEALAAESDNDDEYRELYEAVRSLLDGVRSLHVSVHESPNGDVPTLLFVAETSPEEAMAVVPETLRDRAREETAVGDVTVYRYEPELPGGATLPLLLAGQGERLFVGTDLHPLEAALNIVQGVEPETLADSPVYRSVPADPGDLAASLFVSTEPALRLAERGMTEYELDDFRVFTAVLGLRQSRAGRAALDEDGEGLTIRLKSDPSSAFYQLAAQPPPARRLAEFLPSDLLCLVSFTVTDGADAWKALRELILDVEEQFGGAEERRFAEEEILEKERELGIRIEEIAEQIDGEFGLFGTAATTIRWGPGVICRVKDVTRAREIAEKMVGDEPVQTREREGVTVYLTDRWMEEAWAFLDDVIIYALSGEVDQAIDARAAENTLAGNPAYEAIASRLPEAHFAMVYLNVDRILEADQVDRREYTDEMRRFLDGLALGAAVTAGDGIVTGRLVANTPPPLAEFLAMIVDEITESRKVAQRARCASNLRGIAGAVRVWSLQHGDDGTFYPPSLQALLDDDVIAVPEAFICPVSGTDPQPDRFVSDYDSILDRAEFQIRDDTVRHSLLPLAWHKENFHGDGRAVVFFDQHIRWSVDEDRFEELMRQVDDWIRENQPE